jgi:hypothetical protein
VVITVRRTGGFAGVNEQLGPVEADERTRAFVEEIGFFHFDAQLPGGERVFDAFNYSITVEEGGNSHTVSFTDAGDDVARPFLRLIALVEEGGAQWQDVPIEVGGGGDGDIQCGQWSAWYNVMPPDPDRETLHVSGRCGPPGFRYTLEPGDVGIAAEPGLLALELRADPAGEYGSPSDHATWTGTAPGINRVRIQGAASAEIDVIETQ